MGWPEIDQEAFRVGYDNWEMQKLTNMCERLRSANATWPKADIDTLNAMVNRLSRLMEWRQNLCARAEDGGGGGGGPALTADASFFQEVASVGLPAATFLKTDSQV